MKRSEEFLALYREYETEIRNQGTEPKEHEEKVDTTTQGRLRMLRYFRNYLAHQNDPGFLDISDSQMKFLKEYVSTLRSKGDVIKKHLKSPAAGTCTATDKCGDALAKCAKLKTEQLVIVAKDGYYVADLYTMLQKYIETKTAKLSDLKLKKGLWFVSPDTVMAEVPEGTVICTSDGTPEGKLLGVKY